MSTQAIFIALGANLPSKAGPPEQTLAAALVELERKGVRVVLASSLFRSPAWPDPSDPSYVNAVAAVETELQPDRLLRLLHETETAFGRTRSARNSPRTLDLDILDYRGLVQAGPPGLPHPRMTSRAFVLVPLAEIAPDWCHPVSGESAGSLLLRLAPSERDGVVRMGEGTAAR